MITTSTEFSPFGTLLKAFRTRQHLTQAQLAEAIGVHRHAIGRWEQGDFLPSSKGIVLELAKYLRLDDQEARHLLEASLTALAPHWSVPLPRNPFFTGREAILELLHLQLGVDQARAHVHSAALQGLGGIGKTQLALEYAYRHALDYSAVFWIGAETEEQIVSSLLRIAEILQVPERHAPEQPRIVAAVQRWLTTHSQWLLIWDNLEDLDLLPRFLPPARQGAILLTTRLQALGTYARGLELSPMELEEGMLFLLRRAKVLAPDATSKQVRQLAARVPPQYAAAAELVTELGGLPLALDQAGAYLEATQCGLPAYLELFRARRAALLQQRGEGARDHPASVATTFTLALTTTAQRHPAVGELLRLCALLQPDAIPEALFRQGGEHLGTPLAAVCGDPLEWDRVVAAASASSLLSRHPEVQAFSLHRLVQAVLWEAMTEAERAQWSRRVIAALEAVFPEVLGETEYTAWKQGERLLPHALLCLQRVGMTEDSLVFASLAYKVAQYLRVCGRYAEAEPFCQRALQIRERLLGSAHPEVATSLHYLAVLFWEQGRYAEAEPLYQRALHIGEQTLGSSHPDIARLLSSLATLYHQQGRYMEAAPLYQRALSLLEQALGAEHPQVASSLNNLALLYTEQGQYPEAEALFQRALHLKEQIHGPAHPHVASSLNNLAELYQRQGQYGEAEPLYQRALHIGEQSLGPDHPHLAGVLSNLAELLAQQGRYLEAAPLYQRALSIWEQRLGPDHPDVAHALNGLATLFQEQGKYAEAEPLFERAQAIWEQRLGPDHPHLAKTLHDLARFRQKQGKLCEALSLAERARSIRSQSLGDAHPNTVATQTLYAQLLQERACAQGKAAVERSTPPLSAGHLAEGAVVSLQALPAPTPPETDPLQEFLRACCELHPRAWSRSADLWQAYERWAATHQERFPLSRRAFIAQLKAHGGCADRTKTARIWRGIALVNKEHGDVR